MTKTNLLYATAVAALLSTGMAAQAAEITGTGTQFGQVRSTGTSTAYSLANEVRFSATATSSGFNHTQGNLTFNFLPDAATTGGFPNGQQLLFTVDVGGAIFSAAAAGSAVISATGGSCTANVSAVTNVAANATTASYIVTLTSCTGSTTGLTVSLPIQVTGANSVTAGAKLEQSFGGSLLAVDGGRKQATFVTSGDGFTATIATGSSSTAEVSGGYTAFASTATAGSVTVTVNTATNKDLSSNPVAVGDIAEVLIVASATSGDFTGFNLSDGSTRFSTASTSATTMRVFEINPSAATTTTTIQVSDNTATATSTAAVDLNGIISPTSITLSAQIDLATDDNYGTSTGQFVDFNAGPSSSYAIVGRNGASFKAPWVALSTTATAGVIRVANNGTQPTGPIRVTLTSNSNGTAPTTTSTVTVTQAQLSSTSVALSGVTGGIPAGASVSILGSALATAFGTTAANGDLSISIEASPANVSAKVRAQQASGQIFETSLGNLQ